MLHVACTCSYFYFYVMNSWLERRMRSRATSLRWWDKCGRAAANLFEIGYGDIPRFDLTVGCGCYFDMSYHCYHLSRFSLPQCHHRQQSSSRRITITSNILGAITAAIDAKSNSNQTLAWLLCSLSLSRWTKSPSDLISIYYYVPRFACNVAPK